MKNIKAYWIVGGAIVLSVFIASSIGIITGNTLQINLMLSYNIKFYDWRSTNSHPII